MRKLQVDPQTVWPFMRVGISIDLFPKIHEEGWRNVPPVPLFEIPKGERRDKYIYALAGDGCHRLEIAEALLTPLLGALYEKDEEINPERDGLALFRASQTPRLYEQVIEMYGRRGRWLNL